MPVTRDAPAAERIKTILARLKKAYPGAKVALDFTTPLECVVATVLSAQSTDARVNLVTKTLFAKYRKPEDYLAVPEEELQVDIQSTGFFRQKTKSLISMSQDVVAKHGGEIPETMDELTELRGVGRKTANVIIGVAFGGEGVVVDTHVRRISGRLGWTKNTDPVKIEQDLMALFPRREWTVLGHTLIWHGRTLCMARNPKCPECPVLELCPFGRARERRRIAV